MKYLTTIAAALVLSACAGSPMNLETKSHEALITSDPFAVCNAYARGHSAKMRAAVEHMHLVRDELWNTVEQGKVRIGMTEIELTCSRGAPRKVNESGTRRSITKQWVYGGTDRYMPTTYVYTDGNEVTGWN